MKIEQEVITTIKDAEIYTIQRTENGDYYDINVPVTDGDYFLLGFYMVCLILIGFIIGKITN